MYARPIPGAAEFDAEPAFPGPAAPDRPAGAHAGGAAAGAGRSAGVRRRSRSGSAPPPRSACSRRPLRAGRSAAAGRHHPWARGRLGPAARRPSGAARIAADVDVVTYLGEYTRRRLARVLGTGTRLERLTPGRRHRARSRPDVDGDAVRARYGLAGRPVVVCVSRLVPRKGQDALIRALPAIRARCRTPRCCWWAAAGTRRGCGGWPTRTGVAEHVRFTGAVPFEQLPAALRGRRRVRDAVPDPPVRAGRRGAGHGVPGGLGDRTAGHRRRFRRRAGRGARAA